MQTFLKQYGARRTGTNYLRWLIQSNYGADEVVPLMHVLGDKHSPPPPFAELWQRAQTAPDPALAFVMSATQAAPADSTSLAKPGQRNEVERLAAPLARAYAEGTLGFLISIKDPYAWAVSVARFWGWTNRTAPLGERLRGQIAGQCEAFNGCYAAWLDLARREPARCLLVRHEELVAEPARVLDAIDAKFALRRRGDAVVDLTDEADQVWWDQHEAVRTGIRFDRHYYFEKRYLQRLTPAMLETIAGTIDWELVAPLGYAPVETAP